RSRRCCLVGVKRNNKQFFRFAWVKVVFFAPPTPKATFTGGSAVRGGGRHGEAGFSCPEWAANFDWHHFSIA
ncbi:MAG: hypothetical protein ACR2OZ_00860, partial [Verrucomicrobiales bacterium]